MAKLIDIKGYWTVDSNNNSNMWEGRILLGDGNYFEGVVVDSNSVSREEELVLLTDFSDKSIELYIIPSIDSNVPICFSGEKNCDGYKGKVEFFGPPDSRPTGNCYIVTEYVEVSKNTDLEINELLGKIENCKKNLEMNNLDYYYILTFAMSDEAQIFFNEHDGSRKI